MNGTLNMFSSTLNLSTTLADSIDNSSMNGNSSIFTSSESPADSMGDDEYFLQILETLFTDYRTYIAIIALILICCCCIICCMMVQIYKLLKEKDGDYMIQAQMHAHHQAQVTPSERFSPSTNTNDPNTMRRPQYQAMPSITAPLSPNNNGNYQHVPFARNTNARQTNGGNNNKNLGHRVQHSNTHTLTNTRTVDNNNNNNNNNNGIYIDLHSINPPPGIAGTAVGVRSHSHSNASPMTSVDNQLSDCFVFMLFFCFFFW